MANGKPSGPESYVLRSGVRIGLKREFAFALKSQADIPNSLSRTRSGRAAVAAYRSRSAKLPRKSNDSAEKQMNSRLDKTVAEASMGLCSIPLGGVAADVTVADTRNDGSEKDGLSLFTRISCDSNEGIEDIIAQERPITIHKVYEKKDILKKSEHLPPAPSFPPYQIVSALSEEGMVSSSQLENGIVMERAMVSSGFSGSTIDDKLVEEPTERLTLLDLKSIPVTASPLAAEQEGNLMEVMPVLENCLGVEQKENLVEIPITLDELGGLEFENGNFNGSIKAEIEGPVVVTVITESDVMVDEVDCVTPLEKPARRFMGSSLNFAIETFSVVEGSTYISGDAAESEKLKVLSGSLSMTPKKKMELKMSKKITLTKLPSNVRHLLGTGLLEGLPVKYISCIGKNAGLHGVIRGNGILCSCSLCQGTKVVSAYQFEIHAGSTKKHPSDFIFLENGKSLRDVLKSCTDAPLDMLEAAIQNEIGPIPPKSLSVCQKCKVVFDTARAGNFALLCDSCLETQTATPSSSYGITNPAKFSKKVCTPFASDGKPKNTSSQKKLSHGKITRKDLGLHKLVFMDDILPQGTEVGYYVRGKRLLEGYIKDSGIFCCCCNSVVSPSQFEAHAGQSSRRKPYNYIYTSNGVSLHELSVSLSKGRKLSATENDDLCGICADGGNLLLCDLCPRAFHRECLGLSSIPNESWFCQYCENLHQKEKHLAHNDNAIAAGRMAGVDPIEQIITRCIRIVTTPENDAGVCALCRYIVVLVSPFFSHLIIVAPGFHLLVYPPNGIMCSLQCETEYHVGCLKVNDMADLKELPEGEWFCHPECSRIHSTLHELLLQEPQALEELDAGIIQKKLGEKGLSKDTAADVKWRLLSGKNDSAGSKLLLSQAVSLFRESFDPIVEPISGRDLVPFMVYGRNMRDQDFGGMYCMVLTMNSSVISAGLLRVLGCEVAELPLVATKKENQGLGFFQSLFSCIVRLFKSLKVKHFVLPAAADAESIWTKRFGFSKVTPAQLREYAKGARPMTFQGTSMLHKPVFGQHEFFDEGTFKPPT